jgi:hypothetical protein
MSVKSVFALVGISLACPSLTGCSDEQPDGFDSVAFEPYPGCEAFDYSGCDILDPTCQENTVGLVRCLRGTPGTQVPAIRLMTKEQFEAELRSTVAEEDHTWDQVHEEGYGFLGLLAPGSLVPGAWIESTVKRVAGSYRWKDKQIIVLVSDGDAERDLEHDTLVLAHEVVHALQDKEYDLRQWFEPAATSDTNLAAMSVVEGEARLYQTLLAACFWGLPAEGLDLTKRFSAYAKFADEELLKEASPLLHAKSGFPYGHGARFVHLHWQRDGHHGIDGLFAAPPVATHPILLSEHVLAPELAVEIPDQKPVPLDGYELVDSNVLGAYMLYVILTRQGIDSTRVQRWVSDWRGDRLWLFGNKDTNEVAMTWRVRLASRQSAADLAGAMETEWSSRDKKSLRDDRDVIFVATNITFRLGDWVEAACAGSDQRIRAHHPEPRRSWWWTRLP